MKVKEQEPSNGLIYPPPYRAKNKCTKGNTNPEVKVYMATATSTRQCNANLTSRKGYHEMKASIDEG
eukprot:scaffold3196_cov81-Cyclotella_meneghiniana.AAC.9